MLKTTKTNNNTQSIDPTLFLDLCKKILLQCNAQLYTKYSPLLQLAEEHNLKEINELFKGKEYLAIRAVREKVEEKELFLKPKYEETCNSFVNAHSLWNSFNEWVPNEIIYTPQAGFINWLTAYKKFQAYDREYKLKDLFSLFKKIIIDNNGKLPSNIKLPNNIYNLLTSFLEKAIITEHHLNIKSFAPTDKLMLALVVIQRIFRNCFTEDPRLSGMYYAKMLEQTNSKIDQRISIENETIHDLATYNLAKEKLSDRVPKLDINGLAKALDTYSISDQLYLAASNRLLFEITQPPLLFTWNKPTSFNIEYLLRLLETNIFIYKDSMNEEINNDMSLSTLLLKVANMVNADDFLHFRDGILSEVCFLYFEKSFLNLIKEANSQEQPNQPNSSEILRKTCCLLLLWKTRFKIEELLQKKQFNFSSSIILKTGRDECAEFLARLNEFAPLLQMQCVDVKGDSYENFWKDCKPLLEASQKHDLGAIEKFLKKHTITSLNDEAIKKIKSYTLFNKHVIIDPLVNQLGLTNYLGENGLEPDNQPNILAHHLIDWMHAYERAHELGLLALFSKKILKIQPHGSVVSDPKPLKDILKQAVQQACEKNNKPYTDYLSALDALDEFQSCSLALLWLYKIFYICLPVKPQELLSYYAYSIERISNKNQINLTTSFLDEKDPVFAEIEKFRKVKERFENSPIESKEDTAADYKQALQAMLEVFIEGPPILNYPLDNRKISLYENLYKNNIETLFEIDVYPFVYGNDRFAPKNLIENPKDCLDSITKSSLNEILGAAFSLVSTVMEPNALPFFNRLQYFSKKLLEKNIYHPRKKETKFLTKESVAAQILRLIVLFVSDSCSKALQTLEDKANQDLQDLIDDVREINAEFLEPGNLASDICNRLDEKFYTECFPLLKLAKEGQIELIKKFLIEKKGSFPFSLEEVQEETFGQAYSVLYKKLLLNYPLFDNSLAQWIKDLKSFRMEPHFLTWLLAGQTLQEHNQNLKELSDLFILLTQKQIQLNEKNENALRKFLNETTDPKKNNWIQEKSQAEQVTIALLISYRIFHTCSSNAPSVSALDYIRLLNIPRNEIYNQKRISDLGLDQNLDQLIKQLTTILNTAAVQTSETPDLKILENIFKEIITDPVLIQFNYHTSHFSIAFSKSFKTVLDSLSTDPVLHNKSTTEDIDNNTELSTLIIQLTYMVNVYRQQFVDFVNNTLEGLSNLFYKKSFSQFFKSDSREKPKNNPSSLDILSKACYLFLLWRYRDEINFLLSTLYFPLTGRIEHLIQNQEDPKVKSFLKSILLYTHPLQLQCVDTEKNSYEALLEKYGPLLLAAKAHDLDALKNIFTQHPFPNAPVEKQNKLPFDYVLFNQKINIEELTNFFSLAKYLEKLEPTKQNQLSHDLLRWLSAYGRAKELGLLALFSENIIRINEEGSVICNPSAVKRVLKSAIKFACKENTLNLEKLGQGQLCMLAMIWLYEIFSPCRIENPKNSLEAYAKSVEKEESIPHKEASYLNKNNSVLQKMGKLKTAHDLFETRVKDKKILGKKKMPAIISYGETLRPILKHFQNGPPILTILSQSDALHFFFNEEIIGVDIGPFVYGEDPFTQIQNTNATLNRIATGFKLSLNQIIIGGVRALLLSSEQSEFSKFCKETLNSLSKCLLGKETYEFSQDQSLAKKSWTQASVAEQMLILIAFMTCRKNIKAYTLLANNKEIITNIKDKEKQQLELSQNEIIQTLSGLLSGLLFIKVEISNSKKNHNKASHSLHSKANEFLTTVNQSKLATANGAKIQQITNTYQDLLNRIIDLENYCNSFETDNALNFIVTKKNHDDAPILNILSSTEKTPKDNLDNFIKGTKEVLNTIELKIISTIEAYSLTDYIKNWIDDPESENDKLLPSKPAQAALEKRKRKFLDTAAPLEKYLKKTVFLDDTQKNIGFIDIDEILEKFNKINPNIKTLNDEEYVELVTHLKEVSGGNMTVFKKEETGLNAFKFTAEHLPTITTAIYNFCIASKMNANNTKQSSCFFNIPSTSNTSNVTQKPRPT